MTNKITASLSIVASIIAIVSFVFSLGYLKANIDQVIERTDPRAEKLRIEDTVNRLLDQRLQTIMKQIQSQTISPPANDQNISAQELPAILLEIIEPTNNARITNNIITVSGDHSMPLTSHVWILLGDSYGNFYLQNPPVILRRDGSWMATNIRPGHGITAIHAIYVDSEGNEFFKNMVRNNDWAGFTQLPRSARILDTVNISVMR